MTALVVALVLSACRNDPPPDPCATLWVRWENFAQPQVQTWCTPCHSASLPPESRHGAPAGVDFDTLAGARAWAPRIAARTGDGTMPPAGGLTDEERSLLWLWASCGALGEDPDPPVDDPCDPPVAWAGDGDGPCARGANGVSGDLTVRDPGLDLTCVCRVDGDLVVEADAELPRLATVGGDVVLGGTTLGSLAAPELAEIGGALSMQAPNLARVDLSGLLSVGGALRVTSNPRLVGLFLDRLDAVGGDVEVVGNPALVDWRGMQAPRIIGGSIRVIDNDGLQALDAFGRVASLGGDVLLTDNDNVVELFGFQKLLTVPGRVEINDNDRVALIETLVDVQTIGGEVSIASNPELVEISGFAFLEAVGDATGGGLRIAEHPQLALVPRFERLARTGGVELEANGALVAFDDAFEALEALGPIGLAVVGNPALERILGFDRLTVAGGPVRFVDNPALAGIAFPGLRSVPELTLSGSLSLVEAAGFDALTEVGGDLALEDNAALADVMGLHGVERVGGTLTIRGNPALSQVAIDAWLAEIDEVGATVITGNGG